jgi:N-acetylated-alpha-linked acidic dipeptidase
MNMIHSTLVGLALASMVAAGPASAQPPNHAPAPMIGFNPTNAAAERALEKKFDAKLDASELRSWLERMSSEPNHVGSPHDKANADFMLEKFREWGWDARIETFYVLYPTPEKELVELVAPSYFVARLHEPELPDDRTSGKTEGALPPYHAYGADGDVTGELVYVNRGMPDDYIELARHGIDVKGKIVIARYGGGWRGLKPKLAWQHGAIGCLIYSDPADDGYAEGDSYPKGPSRPADGVQRGSVADMPIYPGDPLTPGIGATKDAKRLSREEAKTILKIPVLPISYADAQPLLAALAGPVAPGPWRGALPMTYHIGPGPAKVHLVVKSEWSLKPIYDVIATLKGSSYPDEWVIRGNHHDGWVFGAWDPLSGNVALMAEAKAIGALVKQGWRPRRTLIYASWDGEEPGLLGSTEWVEEHADELRKKAVLYVNSDTNGRGFLRPGGSHSFQALVNEIAAELPDPETGASVGERTRAKLKFDGLQRGGDEDARQFLQHATGRAPFPIKALGSGSDYTPFLQHLGIATLELSYGGEDLDDGIYHSVYDSFDHYIRFGDPDFAYGVLLASTIGRAVLRVADTDVLPMRFGDFADTVGGYTDEVHKLADASRENAERKNRLLDENVFKLAADPTETYVSPERETPVPFLNFAPLDNALAKLKHSARVYDENFARAADAGFSMGEPTIARLNQILRRLEQDLTDHRGLPGREWYRHMIYAPGLYTGYGAKTLPGVREAIEQHHWLEVEPYMNVIADALNRFSRELDEAAALLK